MGIICVKEDFKEKQKVPHKHVIKGKVQTGDSWASYIDNQLIRFLIKILILFKGLQHAKYFDLWTYCELITLHASTSD